jgi:hypothetical protein
MKKLLIFVLVLGLTSVANGGLLNISVNGNIDPQDSEYYLTPSEVVTLDIHVGADISSGNNEGYWVMYCQTQCASISGGYVTEPWASDPSLDIFIDDDAVGNGGIPIPAGTNGVWGGIFTFGTVIPASTILYDGIIFHCESDAPECLDTVITLQRVNDDWTMGDILDTLVIHQVPEPASMLLLGLGGLLLRRRK